MFLKRILVGCCLVAMTSSVSLARKPLDTNGVPHLTGRHAVFGGPAEAGIVTDTDVTGLEFWDGEGDANNVTFSIALGAPGTIVNGIGWDLVLTTIDPSWGSEATFALDYEGDGVADLFLTPGVADAFPVVATPYSSGGIIKLGDVELPDGVLTDGNLYVEAFDSFDDFPDDIDDFLDSGVLSIQTVPEPSVFALLGLAGLSALGLRRRN